ncbi:MAG TPA: glycine betaine ABC transporter substrate-binding protein [Vicinamibacteria bacterium]|jgi:glycine betaine/choline ABC-type transport system substrate-binding protein
MRAPALLLGLLALVPACSSERRVVVGSKNFTEQVILGELLAQLLESRNLPVDRRLNLGGTFICHRALLAGDLDLYVEYTGTALTAILKEPVQNDAAAVYRRVRAAYDKDLGLAWSAPLGFENTFAVVMKPAVAGRLGIRTISDLKAHEKTLRPGMGHEFLEREDGYRGFVEAYGLSFTEGPRGIELGLIYQALMEDEVDLVFGNGTDGLIEKFRLIVLEDDRSYFPPYDAAIVYRPDTLERVPALSEVLALLEGSLDEEAMRRLNRLVDDERRAAPEVVRSFIEERGWNRP